MTQREYDICNVNQNLITCQNPASRFSLPDFTCTGALYYSNHLQIQNKCKFNVFPEEQVENRAVRLAAGKFLISSKEDRASQTWDKRKTQQNIEVILCNAPEFGSLDAWFLKEYMDSTEKYKEYSKDIQWLAFIHRGNRCHSA